MVLLRATVLILLGVRYLFIVQKDVFGIKKGRVGFILLIINNM